MSDADVARLARRRTTSWLEVLEQLESLARRGGEVCHADMGIGVARDGGQVAAGLLLLHHDLEPECVPVERERPLEVRHGEAGVVDGGDHSPFTAPETRPRTK